jgi:hypothetical protein
MLHSRSLGQQRAVYVHCLTIIHFKLEIFRQRQSTEWGQLKVLICKHS